MQAVLKHSLLFQSKASKVTVF